MTKQEAEGNAWRALTEKSIHFLEMVFNMNTDVWKLLIEKYKIPGRNIPKCLGVQNNPICYLFFMGV